MWSRRISVPLRAVSSIPHRRSFSNLPGGRNRLSMGIEPLDRRNDSCHEVIASALVHDERRFDAKRVPRVAADVREDATSLKPLKEQRTGGGMVAELVEPHAGPAEEGMVRLGELDPAEQPEVTNGEHARTVDEACLQTLEEAPRGGAHALEEGGIGE